MKISKWWRRYRIVPSSFNSDYFHLEVSYFYLPYIFLSNDKSEEELIRIAKNKVSGGRKI